MRAHQLLHVALIAPLYLVHGFTTTFSVGSSVAPTSIRVETTALHESLATEDDVAEDLLQNLPPVIQQMSTEQAEFQRNLGKAMDTLRKDMPDILRKRPDFDIYDENICLVDPSGVRLEGIDKYKSSFAFMQTFIGFWFSERSTLQFRMMYDFCRSSIQLSWNVVLVPKVPLGRPLYVEGVSYYQLDRASGKVIEHRIEKLITNGSPMVPPYGIFSLIQQDLFRGPQRVPQGVPAGVGAISITR